MSTVAATVTDQLREAPPGLHGNGNYFGLAWNALAWLEGHVHEGMSTLETGCGGSSIVFAAAGARHTVVAPIAGEHDEVRDWCAARGISTERLTFLALPSHEAWAGAWTPEPLDLVLIDGAHGFPYPALDWFHTAPHLRTGGHVVVDDAFLPSVHSLVRFLRASEGWEQIAAPAYRTVVFRKLTDDISYDWVGSRHDRRPHFDYLPPPQRLAAHVRFLLIDSNPAGQRLLSRLRRG